MKYFKAARPYSYSAAFVSAVLGAALARLLSPEAPWAPGRFALVLCGCLLAQGVSNLVNDLVDFKTGLDSKESVGRFNALVSGTLTWGEMFRFAVALGAAAAGIGAYLVLRFGGPLWWIVALGAALAIEYTAPPLKLKYRALGDVAVFAAFGLGMVYGTYFVMSAGAGRPADLAMILLFSLPSASLVVAILQANNHRDREADRAAGARTLANSLSFLASKRLLLGLLLAPYGLVVAAASWSVVRFGWIGLLALAPLASLPALARTLGPIRADRYERAVPQVAALHGRFGLLLALALAVEAALRHTPRA